MNEYHKRKNAAREKAIAWKADFGDYFSKLAKRYGLTEEFKENGII